MEINDFLGIIMLIIYFWFVGLIEKENKYLVIINVVFILSSFREKCFVVIDIRSLGNNVRYFKMYGN